MPFRTAVRAALLLALATLLLGCPSPTDGARSSAKALTAFGFATPSVAGVIDEVNHTIGVTVPQDTNTRALVATFTTTGVTVKVNTTTQVSGTSSNSFVRPVTYTVVAADGSTQDYVVTVTTPKSTAKALTSFRFSSPPATGSIDEAAHTVSLTVPYSTTLTALVAEFSSTGASVRVGSTTQISGETPNDFSSPVTYTVVADDGSTQDYVVTVEAASNSAKALTAFGFVTPSVSGSINEESHSVAVSVPTGTNLTALVASFTTNGVSVRVGSTVQTSGTTANDFSHDVTYTVVAADGSTQNYVVTVTVVDTSAKALTAFRFTTPASTGTLDQGAHTVALTVPTGTNVTALVATFATTGSSVRVGSTAQVSGVTANNFSNPVTYTVVALDGSTQDYVVTVTVALASAKALTAFALVSPSVTGTIHEASHSVDLSVPYGTDVTSLVATFATTGASVRVGSTTQVSGTTANDFSGPLTYTVVAANGSTQGYTVTVTVEANAVITFDWGPYETLSFSSSSASIDVGSSLTLALSSATQGTSWSWYVNNVLDPDQTSSSYVYTPNSAGVDVISVTVSSGGIMYSGSVTVTVSQ